MELTVYRALQRGVVSNCATNCRTFGAQENGSLPMSGINSTTHVSNINMLHVPIPRQQAPKCMTV